MKGLLTKQAALTEANGVLLNKFPVPQYFVKLSKDFPFFPR